MSAKEVKPKREAAPGDFTIKLISGLLALAFLFYGGYNVYSSFNNPLRTTYAAGVAVLESTIARGYVVREELVISGTYGLVMPELQDGIRAAKGQAVAVGYSDNVDSRSIAQARELRSRISYLSSVAATTPSSRGTQAQAAVENLVAAVSQNDFGAERKYAIEVESLVMSATEADDVRAEIAALEAQLKSLTSGAYVGSTIYAPVSGIFASETDGFEAIAPRTLTNRIPSTLDALFTQSVGTAGAVRLVTGTRWSLALVLTDADAAKLVESVTVTVRLTTPYAAEFSMRIDEIGRSENGERVVVFSCDAGIPTVINARTVTAEVMFGEVAGIRIPKEAVRLEPKSDDDPTLYTYVYIADGQVARRVGITILREFGDSSYIAKGDYDVDMTNERAVAAAEASSASSRLREGAEIITRANNLYNGKVIR